MSYKAKTTFSFDGKVYNEGDAVNVTDETALDVLLRRGHITEGKGKEAPKPEGESLMEKVKERIAPEKVQQAPTAKVERTTTGKKAATKKGKK